MAQLKITWTKSYIGKPQNQRRVIDALGLRRLNHTVVLGDTPTIRGMVNKVSHLLRVEELEDTERPAVRPRTRRTRKAGTAGEK
jgi:large subunit ribosomal protein L30